MCALQTEVGRESAAGHVPIGHTLPRGRVTVTAAMTTTAVCQLSRPLPRARRVGHLLKPDVRVAIVAPQSLVPSVHQTCERSIAGPPGRRHSASHASARVQAGLRYGTGASVSVQMLSLGQVSK